MGARRSGYAFVCVLIIHGMPNLSVSIPNPGDQNVAAKGTPALPP